ncbi:MAG: acyl-ACP--UDP-N-acetylglucosamine O-acyltransferase [Muribaculaceae bacterium]|nr:acyl-ACP--UDP-N-acetylglucosamine O-acyltransferase [Muribaculaceae bacterium]MDE7386453.1 acyl-ACP--UDP-N-acetylglucosamine O-acyltransferase [Muribaculaceae bacterium]
MISPLAHIDPTAKIGSDVTIHPFAFIDANTVIGDGAVIMPYASVMKDTRIGARTKIYNGAIVGADPQDFRWDGKPAVCTIGDDCVIRENVIINRGFMSAEGTAIGDGTFIMATSHIGHDCHVAGKCVIGNGVTMAGHIEIGSCTILSSNCVIHEGSKIGDWVLIKGGCRISGNVPPYVIIAHNPASYFGINAHIMRKGEFTDDQIDDVAKAYRHIYQCGTSVFNALQRIKADIADSPIRRNIIDFINDNNLRIVAVPIDLE